MDPEISEREQRKLRREAVREQQRLQQERQSDYNPRGKRVNTQIYAENEQEVRGIGKQYRHRGNEDDVRNERSQNRLNLGGKREQECRQDVFTEDASRRKSFGYTYGDQNRRLQGTNRESPNTDRLERHFLMGHQNESERLSDSDIRTRDKCEELRKYETDENSVRYKSYSDDRHSTERKSLSFDDVDKRSDDTCKMNSDISMINLTKEIEDLDRKLTLLRENNSNILDQANIAASTMIKSTPANKQTTSHDHDIMVTGNGNINGRNYRSAPQFESECAEKRKIDTDIGKFSYDMNRQRYSDINESKQTCVSYDKIGERFIRGNGKFECKHTTEENSDDTDKRKESLKVKQEESNDTDRVYRRLIDTKRLTDPYLGEHKRDDEFRMTNQDSVYFDLERECILLQNLHEQNRKIDLDRKLNEEEEENVIQRIQNLKQAENEIKKRKTANRY